MTYARRKRLVMQLLPILIGVAACQTTATPISATSGLRAACGFPPVKAISYSRTDTAETRRQLVGHNAAVEAICAE